MTWTAPVIVIYRMLSPQTSIFPQQAANKGTSSVCRLLLITIFTEVEDLVFQLDIDKFNPKLRLTFDRNLLFQLLLFKCSAQLTAAHVTELIQSGDRVWFQFNVQCSKHSMIFMKCSHETLHTDMYEVLLNLEQNLKVLESRILCSKRPSNVNFLRIGLYGFIVTNVFYCFVFTNIRRGSRR